MFGPFVRLEFSKVSLKLVGKLFCLMETRLRSETTDPMSSTFVLHSGVPGDAHQAKVIRKSLVRGNKYA